MRMKTLLLCAAMVVLGCATSFAATFTVTNLNDSGAGSLRQAILDANANADQDTIDFQAGLTGTIALVPASGPLVVYSTIEILGPGADVIAVSGGDAMLVLTIYPVGQVSITGLTITDGSQGIYNAGVLVMSQCTISSSGAAGTYGGGIFSNNDLTLEDCTIADNQAALGGGIYCSGVVSLSGCAFTGNDAAPWGGAVYFTGSAASTLTVSGCTFSANTAGLGGAVNVDQGTSTLSQCTFAHNHAGGGGAILVGSTTNTFSECTFTGNSAVLDGGAIFDVGGAVSTAEKCTFTGNSAELGGAISNDWGSSWTLSGCTFSGNQAVTGGAAHNRGPWTATNCTFSGNAAEGGVEGAGGAVWHSSSSAAEFNHCTLFGNSAGTDGGGIDLHSGNLTLANTLIAGSPGGNIRHDVFGTITDLGGNLDSDGTGGLTDPSDVSGTVADPVDPLLGPLQDNGGPTWTHALLIGSPAIDAAVPSLVDTDQRGVARPQDGDGDGQALPDIGAYEHQPADLSISKADTPSKVKTKKADTLIYTITVQNAGPGTASNVVVTDILPSGTGFVGAEAAKNGVALPPSVLEVPAPGTTGTVVARLGEMTISDTVTVTISVQVLVNKTTLVNAASATSDIFDPNLADNTATVSTVVK